MSLICSGASQIVELSFWGWPGRVQGPVSTSRHLMSPLRLRETTCGLCLPFLRGGAPGLPSSSVEEHPLLVGETPPVSGPRRVRPRWTARVRSSMFTEVGGDAFRSHRCLLLPDTSCDRTWNMRWVSTGLWKLSPN